MIQLNVPCKDCKTRNPYCHCTCDEYTKFVEENEKLKQATRNDIEIRLLICQRKHERHKRIIGRWERSKRNNK